MDKGCILGKSEIEKLSGDLIHSLVEKIIVYANHNFEVVFKFNMDMLMGDAENE